MLQYCAACVRRQRPADRRSSSGDCGRRRLRTPRLRAEHARRTSCHAAGSCRSRRTSNSFSHCDIGAAEKCVNDDITAAQACGRGAHAPSGGGSECDSCRIFYYGDICKGTLFRACVRHNPHARTHTPTMCMCAQVPVRARTHWHLRTHACTHTHTQAHTYTGAHARTHTDSRTQARIAAHAHADARAHASTQTHTHTCTQ